MPLATRKIEPETITSRAHRASVRTPARTPKPQPEPSARPKAKTFVAWDGEGIATGEQLRAGEHVADEHMLTLLACSDGVHTQRLELDGKRLSSLELLDFIGHQAVRHGERAIHISYCFQYDAAHIMRDIPREEVAKAAGSISRPLNDYCRFGPYLIAYLPRKHLYIAKLRDEKHPYHYVRRERQIDKLWSITIWDTYGFFQSSFADALDDWNIGTAEERDTIAHGKAHRHEFHTWQPADVRSYNDLELALLARLMNAVRETLDASGLKLHRWNGAGAIGAALLQNELPQRMLRDIELPDAVDDAAHYAFFGGRIECITSGYHKGALWRYDINSAYPAALALAPDLSAGHWRQWLAYEPVQDFALYRVSWQYIGKLADMPPFLPFAWRDVDGTVYFPPKGESWCFGAELRAAIDADQLPLYITIHEGLVFESVTDNRPFAFIERYYAVRQAIKQRRKAGIASAEEIGQGHTIKLGLNSLAGKLAQIAGYRKATGERPAHHNSVYAAWVTAYTRAMVFRAAWPVRDSIIAFATDGVLSLAELPGIASSSDLGGWDVTELSGCLIVQSGVYFTHDVAGDWQEYSRGLERALPDVAHDRQAHIQQHISQIRDAWKLHQRCYPVAQSRFIASRLASSNDAYWPLHCGWMHEANDLALFDAGRKREPLLPVAKQKPWRRLERTRPATPPSAGDDIVASQPRRAPWRDDAGYDATNEYIDDESLLED